MGWQVGLEDIVRQGERLAPLTWFQIGGPAEFYAEPRSVDQLREVLRRAHEHGVRVRLLGGGSNVLVQDEGVKGLVLRLSDPSFGDTSIQGTRLKAGGGAKLGHVISTAVREGLAG